METGSGNSLPAKRETVDKKDADDDSKLVLTTDSMKTPQKLVIQNEKLALIEAKKAKLLEKQKQKAEKNKQKAEKKKKEVHSSDESESTPDPPKEADSPEGLKPQKILEEEDDDYSPTENESDDSEVSLLSEERNHGDMEDFDIEAYKRFLAAEKEESDS